MPTQSVQTKTLEDAYILLESAHGLTPIKRTESKSAIKRLCEIVGVPPSSVLADGPSLRGLMAKASWQQAGLTRASWANLKSRALAGLAALNIAIHRRRNFRCSPAWEERLDKCGADARLGLHRFAGWCTARGVSPSEVTQAVFNEYLAYLRQYSTVANPKERWHTARRAWNRYLAVSDSDVPQVADVEPPGWRGLPFSAFPPEFGAELTAWSKKMTSTSPFSTISANYARRRRKALKPVTMQGYLATLRQSASRIVEAGQEPIERFASLAALVDPDVVLKGLDLLLKGREMDDARPQLHGLMTATLSLAAHLDIEGPQLVELKRLAKEAEHRPEGMSEKNSARIQPFKDTKVLKQLACLPWEIAERLKDVKSPTRAQAHQMQMAALLELLLHIPLRVKSAASLDLDKHFQRPVGGKAGEWRLHIPKAEVKNDKAIDALLSIDTSSFLQSYVTTFRPRLGPAKTGALFVGQSGNAKGASRLSKQFFKFVRRELGLDVNIHLMRHLMAFAYLEARPGDYEGVRQLLGHKQIATTVKFYASAENRAAFRQMDRIVDSLRENPASLAASSCAKLHGETL